MRKRQRSATDASVAWITLLASWIFLTAWLGSSFDRLGTANELKTFNSKSSAPLISLTAKLIQQDSLRRLSVADRVAYQHAIEEVYWRHRIWPKENSGPKPSIDEVMSPTQIEHKVKDYLRNSQLLSHQWQRPITAEQLQAEMERMASQTKQPEVLQQLFAALGNDPTLVAECLARPVLAERQARELYAHDEKLHAGLKQRAENDLRTLRHVEEMKRTSGVYSETEWIRNDTTNSDSGTETGAIRMKTGEWEKAVTELAQQFEGPHTLRELTHLPRQVSLQHIDMNRERASADVLAKITTGVLSRLQEDNSRYYSTTVLEKGEDRLRIATISWQKQPFESWASTTENETSELPIEQVSDYRLPSIAISSAGCTTESWAVTSGPLDARSDHTAVWTGSEMVIWGGWNGVNGLDNGGRYNPSTDAWIATSFSGAPTPRSGHTAVWTGTEMIVWGGVGNSSGELNTGGRYNPTTDIWVATSTTGAPSRRYSHTAVWTGTEMIIWGGRNVVNYLNTGSRYSPSTDSWVAVTTSGGPALRAGHTTVWTGSEMIVWGGFNSSGGYLISGGRYSPNTNSWVATNLSGAPTPRHTYTALWTGTEMIVWGGYDASSGTYLNTGSRYNPSTDSWVATDTNGAPVERYAHSAVWTGSEMIIWGGLTSASHLNSGGRYNPNTNSWVATSLSGAPPPRYFHTAVWTGFEMIVWGGRSLVSGRVNTGGRYNPSTDSWVATNSSGPPTGRYVHTAVWTGSEMIVWGGSPGGESYFNSGGRYDPSTDSWAATSSIGAPAARGGHTAVWTGTEMIVWGGYFGNGTYINSGGRYNPGTDSWVATNTAGPPTPRGGHTAIWTGSEMIIWGGSSQSGSFNSGARYNPSTNNWIATPTSSAPTPRWGHTTVWTDSEMVVWGGHSFEAGYFNSGGRYNPSTNSWVATSLNGAPAARRSHTGVWTGNEMIIWGGDANVGNYANSGGRYNPNTDSWVATTLNSAPDGRYSHTAVWTDSEMIVWGGYGNNNGDTNSGGRYNPSTDSWVATTSVGAPAPRLYHSVVWTGSEMIVWGGRGFNTFFDSGGRYCFTSTPGPSPTTTPPSPTPTATPTSTSTPTLTPSPTATATPTSTSTPILTPTPTSTPTPTPTPSPSPSPATKALNISTRMRVDIGNNVLIGGFIITGADPKNVAVRGIGPSLAAFGVPDALADPTLELRGSNGALILANDNWQSDPSQAAQLTALGLGLQDPNESGLVMTVQPGSYTAVLAGNNQTTGVGLVEVYDTNQTANSQLANISTRGLVLTGSNVMIGGFILGGINDTNVVVRGIGPSLTQFGVADALADPTLELHDSNGALLVSNDNWQDDVASAAQLTMLGLAPQNSFESGIYRSLPPGAFTAILAGNNDAIGVGLVEVYNVQ